MKTRREKRWRQEGSRGDGNLQERQETEAGVEGTPADSRYFLSGQKAARPPETEDADLGRDLRKQKVCSDH